VNRDDRKVFLRAGLIALALVLAAAIAHADEPKPTKPSETFCWLARQARDAAGGEKEAEDIARARGVSEATIAKAKRCPR
jgi:hypothetical protein